MIAVEFRTEDMPLDDLEERMDWCTENFGPEAEFSDAVDDARPWMLEYSGYTLGFRWYFAREEYAEFFMLRWS